MRRIIATPICSTICLTSHAMSKTERREFLDSIRPIAAKKAGQPVRFKVDHLNEDSGWAVLVGGLLAEEGKKMDWSKAAGCDDDLDKLLWVVARKESQGWAVKQMWICSSEPPYWRLSPKVDYARPCGIYANLEITGYRTAEDECHAYQHRKRRGK